MTPRVVFDCMVVLQGAGRPAGPAGACLRLVDQGRVTLCVSAEVLAEVRDVLTRPKVQRKFPVEVKPRPGDKIWIRYEDGAAGEVDLSHLAGKGVFAIWDEPGVFERIYIGDSGQIAWGADVDLCPDAMYMRLTGKTPEEVFPNLRKALARA